MARKPLIRSNQHYYHITARSNNKEYFYLPLKEVWEVFDKELGLLQKAYEIKIGAFVLMSNHFHLLMSSPKEDIDKIMYFLMNKTTLEIQKRTGRINKIFGGRYKGTLIQDSSYLVNVYKYIYRNPVTANITNNVEEYPYSTLIYSLFPKANTHLSFKVENPIREKDMMKILNWLNRSFIHKDYHSIKVGLKRPSFKYGVDNNSGKPIIPSVPKEISFRAAY